MFETLTQIFKQNSFHSIEVTQFSEGVASYYWCSLKQKNRELSVETSFSGNTSTAIELKNVQVGLVINTAKVLTKVIEDQSIPKNALLEHAFPNLDASQFYVQSISEGPAQIVSIARKQHVQEIVDVFLSKNTYATSIYLGNTLALGLTRISELKAVFTNTALVRLTPPIKFEKTQDLKQESYAIGDQQIESKQVLSFLAGIQQHTPLLKTEDNFSSTTTEAKSEFNQMRFFYYGLRSALAILLIGLMVNFFYFNTYYSFVKQHDSAENTQLKAVLNPLKTQVDRLDKLTTQILKNQGSSTSFLMNTIIESLPESIRLHALSYQPVAKRIRKSKPVELDLNRITIKGNAANQDAFADWNKELESLKWIDQVVIKKFEASASNTHDFEIQIQIAL